MSVFAGTQNLFLYTVVYYAGGKTTRPDVHADAGLLHEHWTKLSRLAIWWRMRPISSRSVAERSRSA